MAKADVAAATSIAIPPPNEKVVEFSIVGTSPYVQLKFSEKAINQMADNMKLGAQAKKGKKREARDFADDYKQALHVSDGGWHGIPASAIRSAMISACKSVGFHMTKGKLGVFVEADGYDTVEGMPMIRINGEPEMVMHHVRNATGVADLRVRGMWREWSAKVRIRYDADMFSLADVANLLARAGMYVGIGEGRPDSKSSAGMGWGTFRVA